MSAPKLSKAHVGVALALLKVVQDAKWQETGVVTVRRDESYPSRPEDVRYEVRGRFQPDRALAMGSWMPDRLKDACLDVGDDKGAQVACTADFELVVSGVKARHLLKPDVSRPIVAKGRTTVVATWTSFHGDTDAALRSLVDAILDKRIATASTHVTCIALDDEPFAARQKAKKLEVDSVCECLWVGEEGWDSKVAQALRVEESAPMFFLFDGTGLCTAVGDLADILDVLQSRDSNDEHADNDLSDHTLTLVPDAVFDAAKNLVDELNASKKTRVLSVARRTLFMIHASKGISQMQSKQRLIISGEIFSDSSAEVRKRIQQTLRGPWLNVCALTVQRPVLMSIPEQESSCSKCAKTFPLRPDYVCLACGMVLCKGCGDSHERKHPLIVTHAAEHLFDRSLFDSSCVNIVDVEDGIAAKEEHPDLGCDACFAAIAPKGLRFKNLARDEHELCEKCFQESLVFRKSNDEFQEKFNCARQDCFCCMKTSKGVVFNRVVASSQLDSGSEQLPSELSSRTQEVPSGHTLFSWLGGATERSEPPCGHTRFTWG